MVVMNIFIVLELLLTNKGKTCLFSHPLSKRGILKALGQDPSKSDVLIVSTNLNSNIPKSFIGNAVALAIDAALTTTYLSEVLGQYRYRYRDINDGSGKCYLLSTSQASPVAVGDKSHFVVGWGAKFD